MTEFFAVVTGRDYIKINGKQVPFWDLLDSQPDGWLTSIANIRRGIPQSKVRIVDCGAWTYRKDDVPQIKKTPIDSHSVFDFYDGVARPSDFVVAPDHMYMKGCDMDARRLFNKTQAKLFLAECADRGFKKPMAVVHGADMEEKIEYANFLIDLGYSNLCLGGLAAYARNKDKNITSVQEIVNELSKKGDFWIHVLGLSSPDYARAWKKIGVSSFDGSSYFKKALMHGVFLVPSKNSNGFIDKKTKDGIDYVCSCRACVTAREAGNDTRTFGNSIRNIGRAAHNLNVLMLAHKEIL